MKTRICSAALGLVLVVGAFGACSNDASGTDVRAKTKQQLIKAGIPEKQADCYVKSLDDKTIQKFIKQDPSVAKDPDFVKSATKCFKLGK